MDAKMFSEPRSEVEPKQTPIDMCMDAFYDDMVEAGHENIREDAKSKDYQGAVEEAINMWEIIHHKN